MCAIAGILGDNIDHKRSTVDAMLQRMKHRGPDHTGMFEINGGVLGHNRLSIIDLNAVSNQPFVSEDGRYVMVFNGEIYNYLELKALLSTEYTFTTHSDTEVLLMSYRKWGQGCLDRLTGMFSFAIWDQIEQELFAARDRFGVKPFYYSVHKQTFLFASEIKALWAARLPKRKKDKVWASFFVHGSYGNPEETFWEGIHQLPAGHYLVWKRGRLDVSKWYHFEQYVRDHLEHWQTAGEKEVTEKYFSLLADSINLRFRSDVTVGFNVSGGLDSSLLLSLIARAHAADNICAFTFYTGHDEYDELKWVQELIATTPYKLQQVLLTPDSIPTLAQEVASIQDEPYGGIPTIAYGEIFRQARAQAVTVLLDGQGIDEAWAGYDYYCSNNGSLVQGVSGSPLRPEALTEEFSRLAEKPDYKKPFNNKLLDLQYRDLFYTKIPRALRFNDRVSMMHSTELREPFLDHRLVEMAFALPVHMKISGTTTKFLLRKITQTILPDTIRFAPKRPLQTPQREWLAGELREWAHSLVTSFANQPGLNKKNIMTEWSNYVRSKGDNSFFIWQWINSSLLDNE